MPVFAQAPDMILHIGAGTGEAAQAWLEAGAQAVVLVEPNPALHSGLARMAALSDRVLIVEAALTEADGPARLHLYNMSSHASLTPATGLQDLLPGLREVDQIEVAGLTAASLMAQLGHPEGSLRLVIEAPGSELAVLRSFATAGVIEQVIEIDLTCPETPLYEGAASLAEVQDWLAGQNFSPSLRDATDPDFPRMVFAPDTVARQIDDLSKELTTVQHALAASEALSQQRKDELLTLRPQLDQQRNRIEVLQQDRDSLASTEEALKSRLAEVEAATNARLAEIEAAHKARQAEMEAVHKAGLAGLENAQKARQAEREAAHMAGLAELETAQKAREAEREAAAQAFQGQIEAANQARASVEADLATTKAALLKSTERLDEVAAAEADTRARLDNSVKTEAAQAKRIKELEAAVIATRQSLASLKEERAALTGELTQAQSVGETAQAQLAGLQGQVVEMTETLSETRKNFAVSQDQKRAALEELTEERKQRAALNGERATEKSALTAEIATLRQDIAALETVDKKSKADATAKDAELVRRAERIKELEFRQTLARDELRRTEGQVELIKDLLLRGDRL